MSETKVGSKYIEKDPPMVNDPQLEKKTNDYLAYLKEKLNFILATYGRRLTDADGHVSELIRTAAEFAIILSQKVNGDEIIASINASAEEIKIQANRINLVGTTIVNGKIVATYTRLYDHNDYSQADMDKIRAYILGTGTLTDEDWDKYDINEDGVIRMSDMIVIRNMILNSADILKTVVVTIDPANGKPINIQTTCTGSSNWTATSYIAARHIDVGGIKCVGINSSEKVETYELMHRHSTGAYSYRLNKDGLTFYDDANQVIGSYPKTGNAYSVVEEGTQIGWKYRKWNSGFCEMWYEWTNLSAACTTSLGGGLYYGLIPAQPYPFTFASAPNEQISIKDGSGSVWLGSYDKNTTTQSARPIAIRTTSMTVTNMVAHYYVAGYLA